MNYEFLKQGIKRVPYSHQLEAVDFFERRTNGNLFYGMGAGKTGTAILIYRNWCRQEGRLLRALVLCPSVVIYNWQDEFGLFSKIEQSYILPLGKGTGKDKAEKVRSRTEGILIANYEALLSNDLFEAIYNFNPEVIIFDEVHLVKNATAKRSKLVFELAKQAAYRLGLTGTPLTKNAMDIYGIFKAIDLGETFGTNQYVYQAKYMVDANAAWKNKSNYFPKLINNPKTFQELNDLIYKKSLRKQTHECIDLPDLIEVTHQLDLSREMKKAYDEIKRDFLTFIETSKAEGVSESVTANLAVTKALRLLQVASGYVQLDNGEIHQFKDVPKLDYAKELLEEIVVEGDNKCIVWCCFKANYHMIAKVCEELKIKYVFMTGEQSTSEKRESELAFNNDPEVKVIIANRSAGGVGVNLKAASHSIIFSRNFSLLDEQQSMARNYRGGSKDLHDKIIKIDLVTKDSIELQVLEALRNKEDVSKKVIDLVKGN